MSVKDSVVMYDKAKMGVSMFSGSVVEVIGERTVTEKGKTLEQYLYNIVGYEPDNGEPFVSLKVNIIVD